MSILRRSIAVVVAIGALAPSFAGGQIASPLHEGSWLISGGGGLSRSHQDGGFQSTTLSIAPSGLRFVTPHLAVGGSASFGYTWANGGNSYSFGLGPTANYYFADAPATLLPFISLTAQPVWINSRRQFVISGVPTTVGADYSMLALGGSVGLTKLVATHVGITGEAYYVHNDLNGNGSSVPDQTSYNFGLRFGLSVFVH